MNVRGVCWLKRILFAPSVADLQQITEAATAQLGFRYFMYRGCPTSMRSGEVWIDNCPDGWRRVCLECDDDDPLRRRAFRGITPILWRDLVPHEPIWIARARRFGLATGVSQPVHGPSGQWGLMSFIKSRGGSQAEREIWRALARCQLMTTFVHEALGRITKSQEAPLVLVEGASERRGGALTERERQCLTWTAAGKTSAQVATAVGLSERTVLFHLTNARRKLGAVNSRQAITKAISFGFISAA